MDVASVKGRAAPVRLYTLTADVALATGPAAFAAAFAAARDLYLAGHFEEAAMAFRTVGGPLAAYLAERCDGLLESGAPWPGYFVWGVK
jgi:hypothetical protein